MANIGSLAGTPIDPTLLSGVKYLEPTLANGAYYPRWIAYLVAFSCRSVAGSVSITTGSVQGSNPITAELTEFTAVTAGTAVTLPTISSVVLGRQYVLANAGGNTLLVFPSAGQSINGLAANASFSLVSSSAQKFIPITATRWRTY